MSPFCLSEPATVQNPTAVHSARDDFLKVTGVIHWPVLPLCESMGLTVFSVCCSQVYWRHAAGDLDRYVVLIRYNLTVLQNKSVSAGQNECVFSSLTPGRLYTVTVETWSGGCVSSISTDGRTCESEPSQQTSCGPGLVADCLSLQSQLL